MPRPYTRRSTRRRDRPARRRSGVNAGGQPSCARAPPARSAVRYCLSITRPTAWPDGNATRALSRGSTRPAAARRVAARARGRSGGSATAARATRSCGLRCTPRTAAISAHDARPRGRARRAGAWSPSGRRADAGVVDRRCDGRGDAGTELGDAGRLARGRRTARPAGTGLASAIMRGRGGRFAGARAQRSADRAPPIYPDAGAACPAYSVLDTASPAAISVCGRPAGNRIVRHLCARTSQRPGRGRDCVVRPGGA